MHLGVDTVELKGKPFEIHVVQGQRVTPATLLAEVDWTAVKMADKATETMVIITNMEAVAHFQLHQDLGQSSQAGDVVIDVVRK